MEVYDCSDALDKIVMGNLPTKTKYNALDATKPDDVKTALVYKQNRKVCAIMRLGQQINQGMTLILKYKSKDFPHGVAWTIVGTMKLKHTLKDTTVKMKMDAVLDQLVFLIAEEFHI